LQSALAAVTPELLDSNSIIGTPAEIAARLDQWIAAGVDEPILAMPPGPPDQAGPKLAALMSALKG